jgi:hypothetical protein
MVFDGDRDGDGDGDAVYVRHIGRQIIAKVLCVAGGCYATPPCGGVVDTSARGAASLGVEWSSL